MKMKPAIFITILVLILSSCSFEGRGLTPTDESNNSDKVLIGFSASTQDMAIFQPLIDEFNAQNPDIQVRFVDAGEELDRSDQFNIADTSAVIYLEENDYTSGHLRDLTPFIQSDTSFRQEDYYDSVLERVGIGGKTYGVPYLIQLPMLHYNQDLIRNNGVILSNNWSWGDFTATIQGVTDIESQPPVYGFLDENIGATTLIAALNARNSQIIYNTDKPSELRDVGIEEAIEEVMLLYENKNFYTREQANEDGVTVEKLIQEGRVAIWPAYMFSYEQNIGTSPINIGSITYPDSPIPSIAPGYNFVMSSGTQHPTESWRWISFISKQYLPGLNIPISDVGWSPARKTLRDIFLESSKLSELDIAMQQALLTRSSNRDLRSFNFEAFSYIRQAMSAVLKQGISVQNALQEAQVELDNYYASLQQVPTQTPNPVVAVPTLQPVDQPNQDSVVIRFSGLDSSQYKQLIENFNRGSQGIFVQLVSLPPEQTTSLAAISQSTDCFAWNAVPVRDDISSLLNIEPLMSADSSFDESDYLNAVQQLLQFDGKYYGLPYEFTPYRALYYNKSVFDQFNLEYPSANWDINQFVDYALLMTSSKGGVQTYGFASPKLMTSDLDSLLFKLGADLYYEEENRVNYTSNANKKAIQTYVDVILQASPHIRLRNYELTDNNIDSVQSLVEGRVGMWFGSLSDVYAYSQLPANIGVTLLPYGWGGIGVDDYSVSSLYISANTTKRNACWEVIKYLQSSNIVSPGSLSARRSNVTVSTAPHQEFDVLTEEYISLLDREVIIEKPVSVNYYWLYKAVDRILQGQDIDQELTNAERLTNEYIVCLQSGGLSSSCATSTDPSYQGDTLQP